MKIQTSNAVEFQMSELDYYRFEGRQFCYDKSNGYVEIKTSKGWIDLHRVLMNAQKGQIVDHINRNKLDNRRENLRFVSHSINNFNKGSTGIYFDKCGNRWRACISDRNGKTLKLGSFKTKDEALKARKDAERLYFSEHFDTEDETFKDPYHFQRKL